ncbi:PREDICTED: uncharacterized protein LOC104722599 [Camelina sativa]|nr:PREDICTED: uncharacterized protein LOC104722599 [Camelina sativa]XP_010439099.1 PREDICTED: uncharacterized protein LOC104722599 [Camelina sativa]XP_010439100.1 PREDICTED: uncharacterized protein LOC104722599 [Camelina sativa]
MRPTEEDSEIIELDVEQLYEETEDHMVGDQGPNENEENQDHLVGDQGPNANGNITARNKRDYSNAHRWAVYNALLERSVNGKLGKSTKREVSNLLRMHIRTVQRIWRQAKATPAGVLVDVSQRRKNRCGRKKILIDIQ